MHATFQRIWKKCFPYVLLFLYCLAFVVICNTYINVGDLDHDYPFHLGRIVGLAQSFQNGDFLPSLNFVFEKGIGYASPIFYGNWMLYLPALLYLAIPNVTIIYSFYIFLIVLASSFSAYWVAQKMGAPSKNALLYGLTLPLTFPWFGYGMTMVVFFVPLLFYAMYKVLYQDKKNPVLLGIIIALLIQTHVLSTFILAIYSALFVVLSFRKWTWAKIGSFLFSALLGLFLSLGYLGQYFEQVSSQTFFFNWTLRPYPFTLDRLMTPDPLWKLFIESENLPALLAMIALLFKWKKLSAFSKKVLVICLIMVVVQSSLLPWEGTLRYSFLAILQDTRRLAFFVPCLVLLVAALEWPIKVNGLFFALQSAFYIMVNLALYPPTSQNLETIESYNQRALVSLENPEERSFNAVGDEYFNIVINQVDKESGILTKFQSSDGIEISNVKRGYNLLEFDYALPEGVEFGDLYLPRIYYKGYVAEYSQGGQGSQPALKTRLLTTEEKEEAVKSYKPTRTSRAEYNGKIYLQVSGSGHVKVYYQKTPLQMVCFGLETSAWILVGAYLVLEEVRQVAKKKATVKSTSPIQSEPSSSKMKLSFPKEAPRSESLIARDIEAAKEENALSSWWQDKKTKKQEEKSAQIEERLSSTWSASAQSFLDSLDMTLEIEKDEMKPTAKTESLKDKSLKEEKKVLSLEETKKSKKKASITSNPKEKKEKSKKKKPKEDSHSEKQRKKKQEEKSSLKEEKEKSREVKQEEKPENKSVKPKTETKASSISSSYRLSNPQEPLVTVIEKDKNPKTVVDGFFQVTYVDGDVPFPFQDGLQPLRYEKKPQDASHLAKASSVEELAKQSQAKEKESQENLENKNQ